MLWLLSSPLGLPVEFLVLRYSVYLLLSPYICFISFLYLGLYVLGVFNANQTSICLDPHLK